MCSSLAADAMIDLADVLAEKQEKRGWKPTCLDAFEEMDLVGEAWQKQQAERGRGRGVKMRRSRSPRTVALPCESPL